jgi:probable rRNA maturation factor
MRRYTIPDCLIISTVRYRPVTDVYIRKVVNRIYTCTQTKGFLSIHCIGDRRMRTLNRRYRGIDRTTDVLSFAIQEGEEFFVGTQDDSVLELGDIFISIPQISRQAKRFGISEKEEFTRMLVHGVLHVLGYDHVHPKDAQKMFFLQEKILTDIMV